MPIIRINGMELLSADELKDIDIILDYINGEEGYDVAQASALLDEINGEEVE